ncbi:MAG: hypothetical protein ACR2G7_13775 [Acidimicrobiales bacterium]
MTAGVIMAVIITVHITRIAPTPIPLGIRRSTWPSPMTMSDMELASRMVMSHAAAPRVMSDVAIIMTLPEDISRYIDDGVSGRLPRSA